MLLTIDLGNTNVVFGLFQGKRLVQQWRQPSDRFRKVPHNFKCEGVVVASVVPALDHALRVEVKKRLGVRPYFVTGRNIKGIRVRVNKSEVGADRVVDALAAFRLYGGPCLIVDFGTATTFDLVSSDGEYLGGSIAPGIMLGRDALYERTAKLPLVEIKAPRSVIGTDTVTAIQSGLVFGYVAMVEGMIQRIKSQIPSSKSKIKVIATGGLAKLICKHTEGVDSVDPFLTLKGLQMIGEEIYDRRIK